MSKGKLVEELLASSSDKFASKNEAERAVDAVFSAVGKVVGRGERVSIRGFGNFQMKDRAERMARNPRTGEGIRIAARKQLTFKERRD